MMTILIMLALLFFGVFSVNAQPEPPLFYHHYGNNLIKNYGLPSQSLIPLLPPDTGFVSSVAISPDGQFAAFCVNPYSEVASRNVYIMNINTGAYTGTYVLDDVTYCDVGAGAFSPDGSQIVVGYAKFDYGIENPNQGWGFRRINVTTLLQTANVTSISLAGIDPFFPHLPVARFYNNDFVVFTAFPIYIEGGFSRGVSFTWSLIDGSISPYLEPYNNPMFSRHPVTSEVVYSTWMAGLPTAESYIPYLPTNNVVLWDDGTGARIVYTTSTALVYNVDFTPSGSAIEIALITNPAELADTYVFDTVIVTIQRDGSTNLPYAVSPEESIKKLVWVSPLISPTFSPSFATVPVTCSGSLPPRLTTGGRGRVTPGTPNNVRIAPGTSATRVGEIAGGGEFFVLGGPYCDGQYAWWNALTSSGLTGWTAESNLSSYFIDPVP